MEVFIGLVVGAVVSAVILMTVAKMVYKKTRYNGLKGLPKFLMYVEGIALLAVIGLLESGSISAPIIIIGLVLATVLFTLVNLKAGITYAVIMAITQVVCGGLVALLMVITFLLGLFTGGKSSGVGKIFTINEQELVQVQQSTEENINRVNEDIAFAKEENDKQADGFSQNQGFRNADEAQAAGLETGKQ